MTYDTGNAVPSDDPRDLDDNAQALDRFCNSTGATEPDRFGVMRRTLAAIQALFGPNSQALDALAGAADRLIFFTGPGAMALAAFTNFSRTVLAGADALAWRTTLGAAAQTQGGIEGLLATWTSSTAIAVSAGSAYVPSVGRYVTYAGGTITPVGAIGAFVHVYLTATGTIEQAVTDPVRYYATAFQKTGDNSRRYLFSMLISTTANQVYKFTHDPESGRMTYTHGDPQAAKFKLLTAASGTATFTTRTVAPLTATELWGGFQNAGTGAINFTPSDSATSVATGWAVFVPAGAMQITGCPIGAADGLIAYSAPAGSLGNCYALGYRFQR